MDAWRHLLKSLPAEPRLALGHGGDGACFGAVMAASFTAGVAGAVAAVLGLA